MNDIERQEVGVFLRQGEWFGGLPPALQNLILQRSILRTFAKGQMLQREDSPSAGLTVVLEGQVTMLRHVGDGEAVIIHVDGPGFWFGQFAVMMDEPTISALAQTDVKVLILPKREFDRIIADEPRYYPDFAKTTFERFRTLLRYFAETIRLSPEYRLRLRLADLAEMRRAGSKVTGRAVVLDISQAELAEIVGLSRQRLNGRLKALVNEGWIELAPRRIRVLDPNGLRASAVGEFARSDVSGAGDAKQISCGRASSPLPSRGRG